MLNRKNLIIAGLLMITARISAFAADTTPPAKIYSFIAATGAQINLQWRAPGDDGATGTVYGGMWQINYSSRTGSAADSAEYSVQISSSWTPNSKNVVTLTGFLPSVTYYFWLKARDDAGNWSIWSDTKSAAAGSFVLYSEPAGAVGIGGSVVWGDFDNDGDLDFAVCGYGEGKVAKTRIYRNDNGTFNLHAELPGLSDGSLAWGDFDNDGDLDLAQCGAENGYTPRTRIYRNDKGAFNLNSDLKGVRNSFLSWGDFDNDGDLDLALCGNDSTLTPRTIIYRNDNGVFNQYADLPGLAYGSVAWGDFDNDGDPGLRVSGLG
jgi:hypothetical protein